MLPRRRSGRHRTTRDCCMHMKGIEELQAKLTHRVEQHNFAGAASVQDEIKAIGDLGMPQGVPDDVASGAATLEAERKRAMEVETRPWSRGRIMPVRLP